MDYAPLMLYFNCKTADGLQGLQIRIAPSRNNLHMGTAHIVGDLPYVITI